MDKYMVHGKAHVFGDNINTDIISPAKYMEMSYEIMGAHAMEGVDPLFSSKVSKGDIIVAGCNFGSGSSRETAPLALKYCGISLIIAKFFARIFFRNCINIGLPVLTCQEVDNISENDELVVKLKEGTILNITREETYRCSILPPNIIEILDYGGLLGLLKQKVGKRGDL